MLSSPTSKPAAVAAERGNAIAVLRGIQGQARYAFREDEFADLTGRKPKSAASQLALQRLAKQGHIVLAMKRPAKWLIVPAEQGHYGAPPVEWWLDDCLNDVEPHYYLALLSAARHWGSAHYALQSTQVMVSRPRSPLAVGKLKVEFTVKKSLGNTPVVRERSGVAYVRVSTREATLLDLIRHRSSIGGIEAVARIASDFSRALTADGIARALDALDQVATAQRLGFVFDMLRLEQHAKRVETWLRHQGRRTVQPLEGPRAESQTSWYVHGRWNVEYTTQQENILKEFKA